MQAPVWTLSSALPVSDGVCVAHQPGGVGALTGMGPMMGALDHGIGRDVAACATCGGNLLVPTRPSVRITLYAPIPAY